MRKSKVGISLLLTFGAVLFSLKGRLSILAEDKNAEIPNRMQPHTIIEYISENEYIILQGGEPEAGLYNENGLTEEEQGILDERNEMIREKYSDLPAYYHESEDPAPIEGMKVYYDSLGFIHEISSAIASYSDDYNPLPKGTRLPVGTHSYDGDKCMIIVEEHRVRGYGMLSTFTDSIGERDNVLQKGDCATKGEYDNPFYDQQILAFAKNANTGIVEYYVFYKRDNGKLDHAVLDIWKTGVEYWGYTYINEISIFDGEYTYTY